MEKITIPDFCSAQYSIAHNAIFFDFISDQQAEEFHASIPAQVRGKFTLGYFQVYISCKEDVESIIDCSTYFYPDSTRFSPLRSRRELEEKGWVYQYTDHHDFELLVDGYRPYWLDYDDKENEWKLKQWGMQFHICAFKRLDADDIISIFRLCSDYAKKM